VAVSGVADEKMAVPGAVPGARLTPAAAVMLALGLALLGGAVDALTGRGLRAVFAVCFLVGCVLSAALVQRSGLRTVVVAPPLVYALLALLSGLTRGGAVPRTVSRQGLELFTQLVLGAPVLVAGTLAALLVVLVRLARSR